MKKLILVILSVLFTASIVSGYLLSNDENGNPYGIYKTEIVSGSGAAAGFRLFDSTGLNFLYTPSIGGNYLLGTASYMFDSTGGSISSSGGAVYSLLTTHTGTPLSYNGSNQLIVAMNGNIDANTFDGYGNPISSTSYGATPRPSLNVAARVELYMPPTLAWMSFQGELNALGYSSLFTSPDTPAVKIQTKLGEWFSWSKVDLDVDIAVPKYFTFSVNAGDTLNARVIVTTNGTALIELYEASVIGTAGTSITDRDKNRITKNTATTTVEYDSNTTTAGIILKEIDCPVSGKYMITGYVDEPKWIFAGATIYTVKITVDQDDTRIGFDLSGIEEQ